MTNENYNVIAGIDTHADTHPVAFVTHHGKRLGDRKFLAVGSGYREMAAYLTSFGAVTAVGVGGTGSYGAERRIRGESDPLDAYQTAEFVLADRGTSTPKTRDGYVEALRVLRTAHNSPMQARTALLNQICGVLTSAAEEVRVRYRGMTSVARAKTLLRAGLPGILRTRLWRPCRR